MMTVIATLVVETTVMVVGTDVLMVVQVVV